MKSSTKLILSEQNHQLFMCSEADVFEQIYQQPFDLLTLAQQGKLNFDPDAAPAAADLSVATKLAPATLIQNVSKPYIIVTLKHYVDAPRHQDLEFDPAEGVE